MRSLPIEVGKAESAFAAVSTSTDIALFRLDDRTSRRRIHRGVGSPDFAITSPARPAATIARRAQVGSIPASAISASATPY